MREILLLDYWDHLKNHYIETCKIEQKNMCETVNKEYYFSLMCGLHLFFATFVKNLTIIVL